MAVIQQAFPEVLNPDEPPAAEKIQRQVAKTPGRKVFIISWRL
jgi:hypothetical protein